MDASSAFQDSLPVTSDQLLEMLTAHRFLLVNLLATGQVAKIELASEEETAGVGGVALHQNLEDRVGAGGVNV